MRVVAFEDLSEILMVKRGSGGSGHFEEEVHADGEIGRVKQSGAALFHHVPDAREFVVPTGRANHRVFAGADTGGDILDHCMWRSEIDDNIDIDKRRRCKCRRIGIVCCAEHADFMPTLASDLSY